MKRALVVGASGQDGSYMVDLLLSKGYEVHGLVRPTKKTLCLPDAVHLHDGDLKDAQSLIGAVETSLPDEVYNFGSYGRVLDSFSTPVDVGDVSGLGTVRLLEAIRRSGRPIKFYQAGSSEMFGPSYAPQYEGTPLRPTSPYGAAKAYSFSVVAHYRSLGVFACNGIAYNHESPRRSVWAVSRKIVKAAVDTKHGRYDQRLTLGHIDAKRDWGYAPDVVRAAWLTLQAEKPGDYVLATGESRSVREFLERAFGRVSVGWEPHVTLSPVQYGPTESHELRGDPSKARRVLGWAAEVRFEQLVDLMVDAELERT